MISVTNLMSMLRERGIRLWLNDGKLRFKGPQGAMTPELLAELKRLKPQIIEFIRGIEPAHKPFPSAPRDGSSLPLSFAQQRMWFLSRISNASAAWHTSAAYRWRGPLRLDIFRRSLETIIERHEALRTRFEEKDGLPVAVIEPPQPFRPVVIDLIGRGLGPADPLIQDLIKNEPEKPFALDRCPLTRVTLVRLAENDMLVLMTLHHIITDGWSMGVIIGELGALYQTLSQDPDRPAPLPPLPVQYLDYAYDQRTRLDEEGLQRELDFWRAQLAGAPPFLELPVDRPRPPVQTFNGASHRFQFDPALSQKCRELCRATGATPFILLLSLFQLLLAKLSGREDVCVGTPVAGRTRVELEPLIGLFVNTLVLRSRFDDALPFREFLKQRREQVLEVFEHQELPFDRLVEELALARDPAYTPVFQVMFALQNMPDSAMELSDVTMEPLHKPVTNAPFDLILELQEGDDRIWGLFSYNTDLFDESTISRFHRMYRRLAVSAVAAPDTPVNRLALISEEERRTLLTDFSRAGATHPIVETDFCTAFQQWANREMTALVMGSASVTYRSLEQRRNALARLLKERGLKPGDRVVTCLPNSPAAVIAFLGTLAAGGVYVPVDTTTPDERIAYLLDDCAPKIILANEESPDCVYNHGLPVLNPMVTPAGESEPPRPAPKQTAYMIYTSGSTGKPKGVPVTHANLAYAIRAYVEAWKTKPGDRCLQFASLSFDASLLEYGIALTRGAILYLAKRKQLLGKELDAFLQHCNITHALLSPSAMAGLTGPFPKLRLLATGGEACPAELVRRFAPGRRFLNAYGPTETTICVTLSQCKPSDRAPAIGRPLTGVSTMILDRSGLVQPPGVPGELCIGGPFVAGGYYRRPALTAERFVPDPFSQVSGARMYRSGDLTRFREDGEIEFMGRIDFQVKLRGFRIEPGEIEACLDALEPVAQSVVVLLKEPGTQFLVAYVRPVEDNDLTDSELVPLLRSDLQSSLPDYMIPAFFVVLEAFPLTQTGKIDRKALPAPDRGEIQADQTPPRDAMEEDMAAIWSNVLGIENVGIHANFFEIGGHSLMATKIMSRVREHFQVDLPIPTLFSSPTVALLTEVLRGRRGGHDQVTVAIVPFPRDDTPIPLSFAQQRLWFLDRLVGPSPTYNMPLPFRFKGRLDVSIMERALDALVERHEILRTRFPMRDGEPIQEILPYRPSALPLIDLSGLASDRETTVADLLRTMSVRCFDLAGETPFRVALMRLSPAVHVLMVNKHHIISDGWSMQVVGAELETFYRDFLFDLHPTLPSLPIQYADFSLWQRERLGEDGMQTQAKYWQKKLNGAPALIDLPTDRPRPPIQTNNGAVCRFQISEEITAALARVATETDGTMYMVLTAAFAALLSRYSGQDDVVIGSAVAGRNHREIEPLIGFFVNMLPLRCELDADPTALDLVQQVRTTALDAYANQDIPFEKIVDLVRAKRDPSFTPLFQVSLSFQNAPEKRDTGGWPGLELEPTGESGAVAKYDLTPAFFQVPGDGMMVSVEYNTDLYDEGTILRFNHHLTTILTAFPGNPPVRGIDLISEEEREQLLVTWNRERAEQVPIPFIHQLIAAKADDQPKRPALAPAGHPEIQPLSYGQMYKQIRELAALLQAQGVQPDMPVPVLQPRSLETLITFLAILEAGGAFVPMDPSLPSERLVSILESCGAELLVAAGDLADALPPHRARTFDPKRAQPSAYELQAPNLHADNAAYLLFTSGSTGKPKGVVVSHRALAAYCVDMTEHFELTPEDRMFQFSSLGFDASLEQWAVPLVAGASVFMKTGELWEAPKLAEVFRQDRITAAELPPAYALPVFEELDAAGVTDPFPDLKLLGLGGEALPGALLPLFKKLTHNKARMINAYGPTETTVTAVSRVVDLDGDVGRVPIGTRRPNRTVFVLDRKMEPTPTGLPGQLCIGGPTVSRGYVGAPAQTAAVFVPDPYSGDAGGRLYATGDLARMSNAGLLFYLGRIDHQVKLRGFRVELGEIGATLQKMPGITAAAVLIHDLPQVGQHLTAYVTQDGDHSREEALAAEAKSWLQQRLPAYMVPNTFILMASFPLNRSGKLDRSALPLPDLSTCRELTAPRDEVEERLAAIWSEVLGVENIGIHSDFFELGGHSLLATRLVSRIREVLAVKLPVRDVFQTATIAQLAILVRRARPELKQPADAITPVGRDRPLPLSYQQERLWILDRVKGAGSAYNLPETLRLRGPVSAGALNAGFRDLMRRHEILRTVVDASGDTLAQKIEPVPTKPLAVIDFSAIDRARVDEVLTILTAAEEGWSFDLERGPLLRLKLFRLSEGEHLLTMTQQHTITDGWSGDILKREAIAFYVANLTEIPLPLPPLPFQYGDYAAWQRRWLTGAVWKARFDFWKQHLAGVPTLQLKTDFPRPAKLSYEGGDVVTLVQGEQLTALKELARRNNCSLYMVLLSTYALLLSQLSRQYDIAVGTAIAGRNHEGTAGLIGCFMNILVMRCDLKEDPAFTELLARVREMTLDAYEYQDMPFEKMVAALDLPPDPSRNPLFQAYFNLINTPEGEKNTGPLVVEPVPVDSELTSKFDLALYGTERGSLLILRLLYNRNLFRKETAEAIAQRLDNLLNQITTDPEQPLSMFDRG
ncbi:MAG: amino acid adenylation domain-containing protein [Acidobacteriota bacterium]|nr:amino acid adenylation domain-containing protein [Acidobacteriota bacterium]